MARSSVQIGCTIFFVILAVVFLALSLFMLIGFDKIYDNIVNDQIVLKQEEDGDLPKSTFWFMHPPANALSHYHIFNISNPVQIEFYGEKPKVNDIGPFVVRETENKWDYTFYDDGNMLRYKNYKTFTYEEKPSCGDCRYDAFVTVPNLVAIGTLEELLEKFADPDSPVDSTEVFLIDLLMLLVGEYPFIRVRFGDLLFDGYEDALLSAAHSELVADLGILNNGTIVPVTVPNMTYMSFFYKYNNSNDEIYEIHTGKDDISKVGQIKTWGNDVELPWKWWNTTESRAINGSDSGGFQHPNMAKNEPISLFQSYMCRSFEVEYTGTDSFKDIDTYRFQGGVANFDTTLPGQAGFRYKNIEKIDYFGWPHCPNNRTKDNCEDPNMDCTIKENMCNDCCDGSKVNDTYLLPPAMYPINCYPGRLKETPFRLLFTTPHFAESPKEVTDSIDGLKQLGAEKYPFSFQYLPRTGICLEANIRFQVAIPIYKTGNSVMASQFPNKILPVFWVDNAVQVKDNVYNKLYTGFVVVPKIVLASKITLPILTVIFAIIAILIIRKRGEKLEISPQASIIGSHGEEAERLQGEVVEIPRESILVKRESVFVKRGSGVASARESISRL